MVQGVKEMAALVEKFERDVEEGGLCLRHLAT